MDKSIDPFYQSSVLESQSRVGKVDVTINELPKSNTNGDTNGVVKAIDTKDMRASRDLRWSTRWLIGAVIILIPWAIIATSAPTRTMGGIRVTGFLVWIEILWTSAWILSSCFFFSSKVWFGMCQLFESWKPLEGFANNTMWTQVCFAMSLVAWGSSSVMCRMSGSTCNEHWLKILRKVLLATIPAAAIFCAEDIVMEFIITSQAIRMRRERHLDTFVRRRNAMYLILDIYSEIQAKEAASKEPSVDSTPLGGQDSRHRSFTSRLLSITRKFFGILFLRDPPDPSNKQERFERYVRGEGSDKEFDRDGKPFPEIYVEQWLRGENRSFKKAFLQEKLDEGAVKQANELFDKSFTATEIMKMMDKDGDGEITTDEVADFLKELMMAMRDIGKSVNGLKRAARSANDVVCFLLLFVVAIIYGTSSISIKSCILRF